MCTKEGYGEPRVCKDIPPPPKCVEEGQKCYYNQKCCGENLICSDDGYGGEMICKEKKDEGMEEEQQKCLAEGGLAKGDKCNETNGHKCCGKTMYCCFKDWICKDRREDPQTRLSQAFKDMARSLS